MQHHCGPTSRAGEKVRFPHQRGAPSPLQRTTWKTTAPWLRRERGKQPRTAILGLSALRMRWQREICGASPIPKPIKKTALDSCRHGYVEDTQQPFIFRKKVRAQMVQVDFLAGEYGGTGKSRRTQKALDIQPRKARGCDLAFQVAPETVTLRGQLPDGAADEVRVRIASVVPFLVMKGMALEDRRKAKDAYDICFILQNYPGGVDAIVQAFKPHLKLGLVKEGLQKIAGKFATVDHVGSRDAADFDDTVDEEERAIRRRDAFEKVNYLLQQLGIL